MKCTLKRNGIVCLFTIITLLVLLLFTGPAVLLQIESRKTLAEYFVVSEDLKKEGKDYGFHNYFRIENHSGDEPELIRQAKLFEFSHCASFSRRRQRPGLRNTPRVQYIHIPKAAGTSIQSAVNEWVRNTPKATLARYDNNAVHASSIRCPEEAFTASVLIGHRGFGYCDYVKYSPRGLFTFTALREPIPRMVSWFDYYLYELHEPRAMATFWDRGSFSDIVKKYNSTSRIEYGERLIRYSGQQQARYLCGYECMGPMARRNNTYTEQYVLDRALQNLAKVDVVGITSDLEGMVKQLKFHLPHLIPGNFNNFKRSNAIHGQKSEVDEEAMEILKKWAWVDVKLHQQAEEQYRRKHFVVETCMQQFGRD